MRGELVHRLGVALGDADLGRHRIGLHVDATGTGQVLLAHLLAPGHVQRRHRLAEERAQARLRQPVAAPVERVDATGPAIAEPVGFERRQHRGDVPGGIRRERAQRGVVDPPAGILHVVGVEAQSTQPDQEMQDLPGDPGQREQEGDAEDDDRPPAGRHGLAGAACSACRCA